MSGCPRGQRFDGFNDVGWSRLSRGTLGVTWYSTSIDEADMALNTRYAWSTGCTQVPGAFDAQTVFLRENGPLPASTEAARAIPVEAAAVRGIGSRDPGTRGSRTR